MIPPKRQRLLKIGCGVLLLAVVVIVAVQRVNNDQPHSLERILDSAVSSIERIRTYSCITQSYLAVDEQIFPWTLDRMRNEAVLSPTGEAMVSEYRCLCNREQGWLKCEGKEYGTPEGEDKPYWSEFNGAYDGVRYRTFMPSRNVGQQLTDGSDIHGRASINILLGDGMGGMGKTQGSLLYWLRLKDGGWTLEGHTEIGDPLVSRIYQTDFYQSKMIVRATLSSKHGYLPRRIETTWLDTNTSCEVIEVTEFHQAGEDSIWIPIRGTYQGFYRHAVFPDGISGEQYDQMSSQARSEIDKAIRFVARPLQQMRTFTIAADSLRINMELSREDFTIEFPPDAKIYDQATDQTPTWGVIPCRKM